MLLCRRRITGRVRQFYLADLGLKEDKNILRDLTGGTMSVATEILSLRQDQFSSVERLMAAFEWERAAEADEHILSRGFAVAVAVDLVLLNVAVHAADALSEPPAIHRTRRSHLTSRRKPRRPKKPQLHQRWLSADQGRRE